MGWHDGVGKRQRRRRSEAARRRACRHEMLEKRLPLAVDNLIVPPNDTGDTLATAQELTLEPGDQRLALDFIGNNDFGPADVDIYGVALEEGDQLQVGTLPVDFLAGVPIRPGSFVTRIFDSAGKEVAVSDPIDTPAAGINFPAPRLEYTVPEDGRYFVGVSGFPNFTYDPLVAGSGIGIQLGGYQLSLQLNRIDPAVDVGDTLATARPQPLEPNGATRAQEFLGNNDLGPSDVDLYKLEVEKGDLLDVHLVSPATADGAASSLKAALRIFDAAGQEVAISPVPEAGDRVTSVQYLVPEESVLYVGASSLPNISYDPLVAGSGVGESTGRYFMEFGLQRPLPSNDLGDTLEDAKKISLEPGDAIRLEEVLGNNRWGPADVDLVRMDLRAGQSVHATVSSIVPIPADIALGSAVLRVFDATGTELAVASNPPLAVLPPGVPPIFLHVSLDFAAPQTGAYFFGVSSFPNFEYDPLVAGSGQGQDFGHYVLGLHAKADPVDVGDTLSTAKPLDLQPEKAVSTDELIGNNRFGANDVDLYRVRLREGDMFVGHAISPAVDPTAGPLLPVLRAFDADGNELAVGVSESAADGTVVTLQAPADGEYFVGVSGQPNLTYDPLVAGSGVGEQKGRYELTLEVVRETDNDVGDTLETAEGLRLGRDRSARVEEKIGNNEFGPADVDIYRLELRQGDRLKGRALGTPATPPNGVPMIPVLRVFDAAGKELALGLEQPRPAVVGGVPEVLVEFIAPADGVYFIGVSSFPNATYDPLTANTGQGDQVGEYLLGVDVDRHTPKDDVGDTVESATPLPLEPNGHVHRDGFLGDNAFGASDVDMYQFKMQQGDRLHAHLFSELIPPENLRPFAPHGVLRVFDAEGNQLAISERVVQLPPGAPPLSDVFLDFSAPADGVYYVGISSSPNFTYDPLKAGSGVGGGIGHYLLNMHLDRPNLPRDVGDGLEAAKPIPVDATGIAHVTGFVGNNQFGPSDVDVFSFEVKQGDVLAATLSHPYLDAAGILLPGLANGVLRAFDAAGNQLALSDGTVPPAGADFSNIAIRLTAPADGVIFVGVSSAPNIGYDPLVAGSGVGEDTGFYLMDVKLNRVAGGDDVGDTLAAAEPLELAPGKRLHVDEILGNNQFGPSDVDMYQVQLRAGDVFQAHIVGGLLPTPGIIAPFLHTVMRAFDAEGNQLATTIVMPDGTTAVPRPFAALEFEAPADGLYYLGVSSFPNVEYDPQVAGSGVGDSVGRYFLGVDIRRMTPTVDVGDQLSDAKDVELDANSRASVTELIGNNDFGTGDVDIYRVKLTQGDTLNLLLHHPMLATGAVTLEGFLRVFDAAGQELTASGARTGFNNIALAFRVPADGEYFVGVSSVPNLSYDPNVPGSGRGSSRGAYKLDFAVNRPAVNPDEGAPANRVQHRAPRRWAAAIRAGERRVNAAGQAGGGAAGTVSAAPIAAAIPDEASALDELLEEVVDAANEKVADELVESLES